MIARPRYHVPTGTEVTTYFIVCFELNYVQGKDKPVIKKALVELEGDRSMPFKAFAEQREKWMVHDMYRAPGVYLSLQEYSIMWIVRIFERKI